MRTGSWPSPTKISKRFDASSTDSTSQTNRRLDAGAARFGGSVLPGFNFHRSGRENGAEHVDDGWQLVGPEAQFLVEVDLVLIRIDRGPGIGLTRSVGGRGRDLRLRVLYPRLGGPDRPGSSSRPSGVFGNDRFGRTHWAWSVKSLLSQNVPCQPRIVPLSPQTGQHHTISSESRSRPISSVPAQARCAGRRRHRSVTGSSKCDPCATI